MLACARVVAVSGVPPGGMCARGWEESRVTQGLAKQLGQWQGQFPPWGGHRRRSLVGSGVGEIRIISGRGLFEMPIWNSRGRQKNFLVWLSMNYLTCPLLMDIWVVSSFCRHRQCYHQLDWWGYSWGISSKWWRHWFKGYECFLSIYCQMVLQKGSTNLYSHQKFTRMSSFPHSCQQWVLSIF